MSESPTVPDRPAGSPGAPGQPGASRPEPGASRVEPGASQVEPGASRVEPGGLPAGPGGPSPAPTLSAAPTPRRPAAIGFLGMLLAIALTALGALLIYDAVLLLGWAAGRPLLNPALTGQAALSPGPAVAVWAVVAVLLGVALLVLALRRAKRRGVELGNRTGAWLSFGDLERLAAGAADRVDGVLSARARATARQVTVSAETTSPHVEPAVREAVVARLSGLASSPRVVVRARSPQDRRSR